MPLKPCASRGCGKLIPVGQTYCEVHAKRARRERWAEVDARRASRPSRKWYRLARWRTKARGQLMAQPLCAMCPDWSRRPATVADHVVPHGDDPALFWSGVLQSLCKPCHDIRKQRQEWRDRQAWRGEARRLPRDLRRSAVPLTIVCGPPASGKSTWVRERAAADDLVIDLDAIRLNEPDLGAALELRNEMLRGLSGRRDGRAWFIVSAPEPDERMIWHAMLGGRLQVLDVPADVCIERIRRDPLRLGQQAALIRAVKTWWDANPDLARAGRGVVQS